MSLDEKVFFRNQLNPKKYFISRSLLDYCLVLILILSSTHTFFAEYEDEKLGIFVLISVLAAFFINRSISFMFFSLLIVYAVWIGFTAIYFDVWNAVTVLGFFTRIALAYAVLLVVKERFIPVFVDIVVYFSAISIPFYLIGLAFPSAMQQVFDMVPDQLRATEVLVGHGRDVIAWSRVDLLFYTFSPQRVAQNHGFMWEPTAFAFMIIFAFLFKMMRNGRKFDRVSWILIFALITTLSTTGYFVLMIILTYLFFLSEFKYKLLGVILFVPIVFFVSSSDFLLPKVMDEFSRGSAASTEEGYGGNSRFSSFLYDIQDTLQFPLGIGIFEENRHIEAQKYGSVNGLSDTLARFGMLGFLVVLVNLVLSLRVMPRSKELPMFNVLFVLCTLLLSWSERFYILPFFFAFQYYHFVVLKQRNLKF